MIDPVILWIYYALVFGFVISLLIAIIVVGSALRERRKAAMKSTEEHGATRLPGD